MYNLQIPEHIVKQLERHARVHNLSVTGLIEKITIEWTHENAKQLEKISKTAERYSTLETKVDFDSVAKSVLVG